MKKLLTILLICMVFFISIQLVSAANWDNKYKFNESVGDYGKYEIRNSFLGLGWFQLGKVAELELKNNTEVCPDDNCKAEITINHYQNEILVEEIRFIDTKTGKEIKIKSYELKINGQKYNVGEELPKADYNLEVLAEVKPFQVVDWQIKVHGKWLDEWAIFGSALADGLLYYYTMDGKSGRVLRDSMDRLNGETQGNVTGNVTGILNTAFNFSGGGEDFINTSQSNDLNFGTKGFTVSGWVNVRNKQVSDRFVAAGATDDGANQMWFMGRHLGNDALNFGFWDGSAFNESAVTVDWQLNRWYHFLFTRAGKDMRIYWNGTNVQNWTFADDVPINSGSTGLIFGARHGATPSSVQETINGSLDEFIIYNKSLTNAEVLLLYGDFSPPNFTNLIITLNSPVKGFATINRNIEFNITAIGLGGATIKNASLFHNGTGSFVRANETSGLSEVTETITWIDTFTTNNFTWFVEVCDSNDLCLFSTSNRTLSIVGIVEINRTFNNLTFGGSEEEFTINFILSEGLTISDAKMNYNGTNYTSSILFLGGEYKLINIIVVPIVNKNTNFSFNFIVTTDEEIFESSFSEQQVVPINMTECVVGGTTILNLTLFDEKLKSIILGDIEINAQALLKSSLENAGSSNLIFNNVTNISLCLSPIEALDDLYLDTEIRYSSEGYATEFYHIQRADLVDYPIDLNLFDLNNNQSTEFLVTYQDENLVFVEGAIVQLQRKYISEDLYEVVEAPLTADNGNVVVHIDLNTNKYKATVVKNGEVLDIFNNLVFSCENELSGQCTQKLFGVINPQNDISIEKLTDFSYAITQLNDTITTLFSIPSGVPQTVNILMIQVDQFNNSYICNNTLFSSAGSVDCVITPTIGGSYLGLTIKKSNVVQAQKSYIVEEDLSLDFIGNNYFILFILMLSVIGMAFTSPEWIIINGVITMVIAGALYLANGINFVVGLGNLIWLLIAAVILILKQTQQEDR